MLRLRDQSIGRVIAAAFAGTLLLMALLVGITLHEIDAASYSRHLLIYELIPAHEAAKEVRSDITHLGDCLRLALLTGSPVDLGRLSNASDRLTGDMTALARFAASGQQGVTMKSLEQAVEELRGAMQSLLDRSRRFGSTVAGIDFNGQFLPLIRTAVDAAGRLEGDKNQEIEVTRDDLMARSDRLWIYLLTGFFGAALICILVARSTIGTITVPARRLVVAARVLEHGEYARAIELGAAERAEDGETSNEIARLRQTFVRMARGLQEREDRLLQQARRLEATNNRLAALQAITDVALTHLSLDELLQRLLERAAQATDAESGAILLLDDEGRLRARAAYGMSTEDAETTFNDSSTVWTRWLSADAEPVVLPPVHPEDPARGSGSGSYRLASVLVLPLVAGNRVIGLAHVDGAQPAQFGEEAVALMRVFAERVALAIERARAFAALEDWNQILARRLAEQHEKLLQSERLASIGLIGAGIAHELRNPLGVITNSVFFLRQRLRDADEKLARHAQIIEREVEHAVRIIDDLVQFSHETAPYAGPVELRPVFEETLKRINAPDSVTLTLEMPQELPRVQVDEHRLVRVLENLIRNAIQAMEGRGEIRLAAEPSEESVRISVCDTGPGIPPELRQRIFEPLFSTKAKGMGLGLALCRKMVEAWGGSIEVECPAEGGTAFRITLPAAPAVWMEAAGTHSLRSKRDA